MGAEEPRAGSSWEWGLEELGCGRALCAPGSCAQEQVLSQSCSPPQMGLELLPVLSSQQKGQKLQRSESESSRNGL